MAKLHIKGHILKLLERSKEGLWDYEVADSVLREYDLKGDDDYWRGTVRVTLADLYSSALLQELDDKVDTKSEKLHFKYRLSEFGRQRMRDTGLL